MTTDTPAGISPHNQRLQFFAQVNSILRPEMRVLDFGAGRGKWAEMESGWLASITQLHGRCAYLAGFDLDPVVMDNPHLDEAFVGELGGRLPFADNSFDLIVSWATLEHVEDAALYAAELSRILRPGGWLCAWTPNKWTYFAIAARLIPQSMHQKILGRVNPVRDHSKDTYPAFYRLNTRGALRKYFPSPDFEDRSYLPFADAAYFGRSGLLRRVWNAWIRWGPIATRPYLHIFLKKRG